MRRVGVSNFGRVILPPLRTQIWKTPCSLPILAASGLIHRHAADASSTKRYMTTAAPLLEDSPTSEISSDPSNALPNVHPDVYRFLEDPSVSLSELLEHYDLTSPIPDEHLQSLLQHKSRPSDIITLMPSVIAYVENIEIPISDVLDLLKQLLSHMGIHQMIALLPSVTKLFLRRMEKEVEVSVITVDYRELQRRYKGFIQAFRYFAFHGRSRATQALPLPVREQVPPIMDHLINALRALPESSRKKNPYRLSLPFLKYLIHRRYLTPTLRKMLVNHAHVHDLALTPFQLQQCTLSAIEEGNHTAVRQYKAEWRNANTTFHEHRKVPLPEDSKQELINDATSTFSSAERSKEISRLISEIVASRYNQSIDQTLANLEPYLTPSVLESRFPRPAHHVDSATTGASFYTQRYDVTQLLGYAWAILLHRVSREKQVTADALLEMADSLPGEAIVGHTLTPIMHGLLKRGEPLKAWEIWLDLIEREKSSSRSSRGLFVDRVTLAVATEACHQATDIDTAIVLVDTWAKKPFKKISDQDEMGQDGKERTWAGSVPLDAQNINILLNLCRQDGRPSIAFRIWAAAASRYGVFLDDISLNLLLDTARYSNDDLEEEINLSRSEENELFRRRLRAMVDEFRFSRRNESEYPDDDELSADNDYEGATTYDNELWANSSTNILLDDQEKAWRNRPGKGGLEVPWKKARRIFRQVVLGNWPHLHEVKSPLDIAYQGAFGSMLSFFSDSTNPQDHEEAAEKADEEIKIPSPNARFTHIIPTSNTFRSYIALLGYYNKHSEIPLVLGWMKSLNIKPNFSTMSLALLHICESEGPRRWVKGFGHDGISSGLVRDEEIMRKWLTDWLGDNPGNDSEKKNRVPTEQDVADSRRWLAERRRKLTA